MRDWNNFHLWLPGGYYRQIKPNPRLQSDLDSVLKKTGFDIERFGEIMKFKADDLEEYKQIYFYVIRRDYLLGRAKRGLPISTRKRGEKELLAMDKLYEAQLDRMIRPVFDQMLALRYSQEELTR